MLLHTIDPALQKQHIYTVEIGEVSVCKVDKHFKFNSSAADNLTVAGEGQITEL